MSFPAKGRSDIRIRLLIGLVWLASLGLRAATAPDPAQFTGVVLGQPPSDGSASVSNSVIQIRAQGAGLGGRADQGFFFYTQLGTNDFDIKVRVSTLEATAVTARAGLMVRDQSTNSSAMAAIVATPGLNGVQFLSRGIADAVATGFGQFPATSPNAWLRLTRSVDVVRSFASLDGRRWTQIGRISITLTNALVGLTLSSARTDAFATATFTDWADASEDSDDPAPPPAEPPGPSSRRTAWVLSEIHYNPPGQESDNEAPHQFIEIFNSDFTAKEIGGFRLQANNLRYVFPTNEVLPAGGYRVVAKNPAALRLQHPHLPPETILGPWEGDLNRREDTVQLWSPFGALLLEVPYTDRAPWPLAADGEGHTLVLARPSWGEGDARAWTASSQPGGSPGRADSFDSDPRASLRITEIFQQPREGPIPSFIEIFNAGLDRAPITGLILAGPLDSEQPILECPATTLAPGERVQLPIPASSDILPSPLLLRASPGGRVWDAVAFSGTATGVALGRGNLDQPELRRVTEPTPGRPNAPFQKPRLVISEVMYRPLSGRDDDQYLEIWNPGSESIVLTGWKIADGVTFQFPSGRSLAAGERGVIARNSARLQLTHPNLPANRILGEFSGRLSAGGERLTLIDAGEGTEFGFTYRSGGEWPALADGGGSSLELLHPEMNPNLGSSWAASDESGRADWQTFEITGPLDGGTGGINDIRLFLLGAGEALVDDVEVFAVGSTNLLNNPNFETGLTGWTVNGTHERSGLSTNGGFGGSTQALHLRATERGDNGINSVRASLRTGLRAGTNTTLRLRARWLAGTRDLLLRVKGNYLELPIRLPVPNDLGTPARPNSRSLPSTRPALAELNHFPVLPSEGQPVRVMVRVYGDPGNLLPQLRYRIDPTTDLAGTLPMNDAGLEGDRVAGDGWYTAVLPGQSLRTMIAFHATLGTGDSEFRVPRTSTGREALVRWGETQLAGNLGTYRIWITRATETRWGSRPKLHNGDLDATFVYGATRAVYGLGTLYSGSPFVSPGYNGPAGSALCGYVLHFPEDDAFLGEKDFVMDWPIRDDTRQLEQRAYEFAADIGLPYLHRRFIHFYVNSARRGAIYEDTQQPGSAYLRNWSPDDNDGQLHKIEDWFEFTSSGEMESNQDALLQDFRRSDGTRNTARYRWNFRPRSVQESAHDFSSLFRLVDAAVTPPYLLEFQRDLEREMDIDEWAGVFALEHAVGNWDSFGYSRGKNMYAYRPQRGPWRLYMWDIDFVMSAGGQGPGNWPFDTIDSTIGTLYQYPAFQRAYWRAVKKLVNGPMMPQRFTARTEAVRLGLAENGVNATSPAAARTYIRDQRTSLLNQINNVDRPFSIENAAENLSTTDPVFLIQGQGPLEMTAIRVNGTIVPVIWFLQDRWVAPAHLQPGLNTLTIHAVDASGRELGSARTLSTTLTTNPRPESQRLVINEIHSSPKNPGGGFVELLNPSLDQTLHLSGMQLVGANTYEFPPNVFLGPGQFLVLGQSVPGFQAEFGRNRFPSALIPWTPNPERETLAVVQPALGTRPAYTVTAVTYHEHEPWPTHAPGFSLQLRDGARGEDDRVGAWAVYSAPTNSSLWKEFSVTGRAGGTNLLLFVSSFPPTLAPKDLAGRWVGTLSNFGFDFAVEFSRNDAGALSGRFFGGDTSVDPELGSSELANVSVGTDGSIRFTWSEINGRFTGRIDATGRRATGSFTFDNGNSPFVLTRQRPAGTVLVDSLKLTREGDGVNLLRDGDFQSDLGTVWRAEGAHADSTRVEDPAGGSGGQPEFSLRLSSTLGGEGTPTNAVTQSIDGIVPDATYRLSGRYQPVQAQGLFIGLEGGLNFTADLRPRSGTTVEATPGRPNSVAGSMPAVPLVWLNEVQPENLDGRRDASGKPEPWVELHNSDLLPTSLDRYFLSDDPLQPKKWTFPPGTTIPSGGFLLVWLDGQTAESTPDAPHAPFRPTPRDGTLVLSQERSDGLLTVDFLRYALVPPGLSFGHLPEAWTHDDQVLPKVTPGQPNGGSPNPDRVWINEWAATNDGSIRDPSDADADDWFELYNPESTPVDLSGWFLTDTSTNPTKFRIPPGYRIPPGGVLLVWADEETGQNQPGTADLHVNFRLSGSGEEILLSRPDGTKMDHVIFGAQVSGSSQGRNPDGAAGTNYVFFTQPTPGRPNSLQPPVTPDILAVEHRADGSIRVRFAAQPGVRYRLRTKVSLNEPTWIPAAESTVANGPSGDLEWRADGAIQRFFQVERVTSP